MNRRRFLKYAGATTAVAGASALGLDYSTRFSPKMNVPHTSTAVKTSSVVQLSTTTATPNMPSAPTHLLASVEDFQRVWQLVQSNQQARSIYVQVKHDADTTLSKSPYRYQLVGESGLLRVSEHVTDRIYWLGLLYRLTGDIRYRDRAWQELESVSQFPDWQPDIFLATAEMAHAFAIGYDWFDWNDEQRKILQTAIVEKALKPALESYHKKTLHPFDRYGWVLADMNHNQVCNGGIGLAALAVLPDLPDLSRKVLQNAVESLKLAMRRFAPDGGWREGPDYWYYATYFNCIFLAALQTALGTDYGLSEMPGFAETGLFPIYLTGPSGTTFNFSDTWIGQWIDKIPYAPQMLWLAGKFHRSVYSWYVQNYTTIHDVLDLLWFETDGQDPQSDGLPLDKHFQDVGAVLFRSTWNDRDAIFAGFKAGDNGAPHAHLDIGSFVLDALGQRWALDLGGDNYDLSGYFDEESQRWTYYRMRAEGHNTLVINPSGGPDQDPRAAAKITRFKTQTEKPFAIADLTTAYPSYVLKSERGIALPNRDSVIVQDEVTMNQPIELWWFMHTPARIESDGQTALLSQGSMRLWCAIISPQKAEFTAMDAKPLPSSPNPAGQNSNYGIRKIAIHLPDTGPNPFTLAVAMVPLKPDDPIPTTPPPITPLANW